MNLAIGLMFVLAVGAGLRTAWVVDARNRVRLWRLWLAGAAVLGGGTGIFFWAGTGAAVTGVIPAIIVFVVSWFFLQHRGRDALARGRSSKDGGFLSGGDNWSGSSSSSGSETSFSGGGGNFGGGGASSDW